MDNIRSAGGRAVAGVGWWSQRMRVVAQRAWPEPDDERGQGLAEYALILALIAIVVIAALAFLGLQISAVLTDPVGRDFSGVVSHITP